MSHSPDSKTTQQAPTRLPVIVAFSALGICLTAGLLLTKIVKNHTQSMSHRLQTTRLISLGSSPVLQERYGTYLENCVHRASNGGLSVHLINTTPATSDLRASCQWLDMNATGNRPINQILADIDMCGTQLNLGALDFDIEGTSTSVHITAPVAMTMDDVKPSASSAQDARLGPSNNFVAYRQKDPAHQGGMDIPRDGIHDFPHILNECVKQAWQTESLGLLAGPGVPAYLRYRPDTSRYGVKPEGRTSKP